MPPNPEDARAVASALAGQREGYRSLFERHRARALALVGLFAEVDPDQRMALVDEAFARAFFALSELNEPGRFGAWLLVIVRQLCLARDARSQGVARTPSLSPAPGDRALSVRETEALLGARADVLKDGQPLAAYAARRQLVRLEVEGALALARAAVKARLAASLLEQRVGSSLTEPPPGAVHLDAQRLRAVLGGERFAGEGTLAQHLRSGCPDCEGFLARLSTVDGLDGEVDQALLALGPSPRPSGTGLELEHVLRRVRLDWRLAGRSGGPGRRGGGKLLPLGLAGLLGVGALAALLVRHAPQRSATFADAQELAVEFSVAAPGAGRESSEAGLPGERYPVDRVVFLRYALSSPAFVTLLRIAPDASFEVLSQPGRQGPGPRDLVVNGVPAGVSLKGQPGRHRFLVIASPAPLAAPALQKVLAAVDSDQPEVPEGVRVAGFELEALEPAP